MASPWALGASVASGLLGGAQVLGTQRKIRKLGQRAEREIGALQGENELLGRQALGDIDTARGEADAGFAAALGSTRGAFMRAERDVILNQRRMLAEIDSRLMSSGRLNTATRSLAASGVGFSTAMQLQAIARSLSASLAPLQVGRGQTQAGFTMAKSAQRDATFGRKVQLTKAAQAARLGQVAEPFDASAGFGQLAALLEQLFGGKSGQTAAASSGPPSVDTSRDDAPVGGMA